VTFADHFSSVAAQYAAYRPHYPRALVETLAERCAHRDVAWDVGCGSGQLSVALAEQFARVIATDPAQAQLDAATPHARVDYRRAPAEASGLPDRSIDLAVAAQAAHWFDWPRFVAEVARVARSGALVALVSYGNFDLPGDAGAILSAYYRELREFWPRERAHVENGYRDLVWPWPAVDAPPAIERAAAGGAAGAAAANESSIDMEDRWTRAQVIGYVASWSATARLVATEGAARFDALRARLGEAWPDDEPRAIRWPLVVKLARFEAV
jgi:ubiquinone/menaquinone biosynthesis C-methylase UbiE